MIIYLFMMTGCSAKSKVSNCLLVKWAFTVILLCTAAGADQELYWTLIGLQPCRKMIFESSRSRLIYENLRHRPSKFVVSNTNALAIFRVIFVQFRLCRVEPHLYGLQPNPPPPQSLDPTQKAVSVYFTK